MECPLSTVHNCLWYSKGKFRLKPLWSWCCSSAQSQLLSVMYYYYYYCYYCVSTGFVLIQFRPGPAWLCNKCQSRSDGQEDLTWWLASLIITAWPGLGSSSSSGCDLSYTESLPTFSPAVNINSKYIHQTYPTYLPCLLGLLSMSLESNNIWFYCN